MIEQKLTHTVKRLHKPYKADGESRQWPWTLTSKGQGLLIKTNVSGFDRRYYTYYFSTDKCFPHAYWWLTGSSPWLRCRFAGEDDVSSIALMMELSLFISISRIVLLCSLTPHPEALIAASAEAWSHFLPLVRVGSLMKRFFERRIQSSSGTFTLVHRAWYSQREDSVPVQPDAAW